MLLFARLAYYEAQYDLAANLCLKAQVFHCFFVGYIIFIRMLLIIITINANSLIISINVISITVQKENDESRHDVMAGSKHAVSETCCVLKLSTC